MPDLTVDPKLLEQLLNYCVDFAKQMLEKQGEFTPFGATLLSDGTRSGVGGYVGESAKGREIYELLQQGMRGQFDKGEIRAAALAADVNIPATYQPAFPDGIRVLLECKGYARFLYLPYRAETRGIAARLLRRPRRLEYAALFAVETRPVLCRPHDEDTEPLRVFVRLLGEGTTAFRPTRATPIGFDSAKLLAPTDFDPTDEHWEFEPGSLVRLERRILEDEEVLVAISRATP
jgi:hypothetical protein